MPPILILERSLLEKRNKLNFYLIPDTAKEPHDLLCTAVRLSRIFKTYMHPFTTTCKYGTFVPGIPTQGYGVIKFLPGELINVFRTMAGDVNPDFPQNFNGFWVHKRRFRSRGKSFDAIREEIVSNPLRHLGAAGIGGAEEKNFFLQLLQSSISLGMVFQEINRPHREILLLDKKLEPVAFLSWRKHYRNNPDKSQGKNKCKGHDQLLPRDFLIPER